MKVPPDSDIFSVVFSSLNQFRAMLTYKTLLSYKISTLWNTIECCRGFEDTKDEISSSLEASDIFG